MWHDTGRATAMGQGRKWMQAWEHYENPETKRRLRNLVEVAGLFDDLVALKPRMATVDEILRFHTPDYVESIRAMSDASGGNAGELTPFGPGSFEIALLAAGGTITAVDAVLEGRVRNAYALVRPPGHHAEAERGRGFCIFGNVVVAIEHARAKRGVARVATVDWDVPTAMARRTRSTAIPKSSRSPSIRIACTHATPAPSTSVVRVPAPASTSTFPYSRARAMAPTSPPSSESLFRLSAHSGRS
jgi:hypothetical protein